MGNFLLLTVVVLGVLLATMVFLYSSLLSKYNSAKLKEDDLKAAKKKAERIVEKAEGEAQKIIEGATLATDELKHKLDQKLVSAAEEVSSELLEKAIEDLDKFRGVLAQQSEDSKKALEQVSGQEFDEVKAEVEEYKKRKMAEIDLKARETLIKVVKEVLGEAFDAKEHEKLVVSALEDAKRQNLL